MTTVAVCGGGIGGLATAIALRKFGLDVTVYEQTRQFARVGADINLTPPTRSGLSTDSASARRSANRPPARSSGSAARGTREPKRPGCRWGRARNNNTAHRS